MTLPFPAPPEILNHSRLRQRTLTSLIAGCTFAGAAAWPVASHAVGLGALSGEAVIGEALQLSVPLTGPIDRPIENECISVRRTADPVDPEFFPRDLAARIDRVSGSPHFGELRLQPVARLCRDGDATRHGDLGHSGSVGNHCAGVFRSADSPCSRQYPERRRRANCGRQQPASRRPRQTKYHPRPRADA